MRILRSRRPRIALAAAAAVLAAAAGALTAAGAADASSTTSSTAISTAISTADTNPVVATDKGAVRGLAVDGTSAFRGLPYAAAPTGNLRWRPPQPATGWQGVRDVTSYGASCPQGASVVAPPGAALSEDCLFLNVSTPTLHPAIKKPVLVWIHGGGLTADSGSNYDGTKLAKAGAVVVTINYRLGALGFLAHPALASRGATGNYGLMDQQAALRWVQRNISQFGGDPHNVTIAGESAGGLSVLAHVTSRSSRGLFQRAIVESGAFALEQEPLAKAEASGKEFATKVGCADQSADCLRKAPVQALVDNVDTASATIPGVVDGAVLKESIGTALAAGRFNDVTILNGSNHDEEALFTLGGRVVSRGYNVAYTSPVTAENYESNIAAALRISPAQAAAIAKDYPLSAYPTPDKAFGTLIGDATFACGVDQVNNWTARRVPTYGYEFNDDTAPFLFAPAGLLDVATHGSEMWYLFDLPNAPFPVPLNAEQTALADTMRAAWVKFAATGNPSTPAAHWPSYGSTGKVLSLELPSARVSTDFAARHHCATFAQNLDKVK